MFSTFSIYILIGCWFQFVEKYISFCSMKTAFHFEFIKKLISLVVDICLFK